MEDVGFGFGVLLAILGPVLLLPVIWVVYRVLRRLPAVGRIQSEGRKRCIAAVSSIALVGALMAVSYIPGRLNFDHMCRLHGEPVVASTTTAEGFFRTVLFPYEANPYLVDGFRFVEAPNPYDGSTYVRYTLAEDGSLVEEEVAELISEYAVEKETRETVDGLVITRKKIYEIEADRRLAEAYDILYEGGPLSVFLGVYGMSSCPDPATPEGSMRFQTFYELERRVLLGKAD